MAAALAGVPAGRHACAVAGSVQRPHQMVPGPPHRPAWRYDLSAGPGQVRSGQEVLGPPHRPVWLCDMSAGSGQVRSGSNTGHRTSGPDPQDGCTTCHEVTDLANIYNILVRPRSVHREPLIFE